MHVLEKFSAARRELGASLIERDTEIDLALTALVCQEHVLLVGPPGTGKSMLANALVEFIGGERFSILLTKFTTPEETQGPISVVGLKEDRYRRMMDGYLPTATVAFCDETFKASSAILNTLLTILNERTVRNDGKHVRCPLKLCIGASNEWPGDQEGGKDLGALFDRFLFRKHVRPIGTQRGLDMLLWGVLPDPRPSQSVDSTELDQAAAEAKAMPWSAEARTAFMEIIGTAKREGIIPGDRRLRKSVQAVQAYAWLNGGTEVEPDHLEIAAHTLWNDPGEQPKKLAEIIGTVANPSGMKVNGLLLEAEQIIAGADPKDMLKMSVADKKLKSIAKSLKEMGPRGEAGHKYVTSEGSRLRVAAFGSMTE